MKGRDKLFDPLFSPKFYEFNNVNTELKVDFPLPTSPETMHEFLQSKDGELFRTGLIGVVTRLEDWVKANGLPGLVDPCEDFKRIYSSFTGKDPDFNNIYFALFRQGLPHLAGVCDLLASDKIPLDVKKDNIKNLIAGIKVCPPGASTNIADTYWKLAARLNLATELMATRRQIVQQIVLTSMTEVKSELGIPDAAMIGMEIHYVNAIINALAEHFAVNVVDDEYAKICHPVLMLLLLDRFIKNAAGNLTVESILSKIAYERDIDTLLKSDLAFEKIQSFEQGLAHYGEDPNFSFYDFIILEGDGDRHKPTWHVDYNMYLTLFNRFVRNGYILAEENRQQQALTNKDVVCYLPGNSLKLACVLSEEKQKPFIPYCIEILSGEDKEKQIELLDFILIKQSDEQRFDIVQGIEKYLNYNVDKVQDEKWLSRWIEIIHDILPDAYKFDLVLKDLPKAAQVIYFSQLGHAKLLKLIVNGKQLSNVIDVLSVEEARVLLNQHLGKHRFPQLIENGKQLAAILRILPVNEWEDCLKAMGAGWIKIKTDKNIDTQLMIILFTALPANMWDTFFLRHYNNNWWKCFTTMDQLSAVLKVLPQDKWASFLQKFDSERIIKLIGHERQLLVLTFYHWQSLYMLLQSLSVEQCRVFLQHCGSEMIRTIFSGRVMSPLPDILEMLPEEKCKVLLDVFGKKKLIDDMLSLRLSAYNLYCLMSKIPEDKCVFLLNYLGKESINQIMSDSPSFWPLLLNKLSIKKCNLFFDHLGKKELIDHFPKLKQMILVASSISADKAELFLSRFGQERLDTLRDGFVASIINAAFTCKFYLPQPLRADTVTAAIKQADKDIYMRFIPDRMTIEQEDALFKPLRFHRDHIFGWILLRILTESPQVFKDPAFASYDPNKLLTLITDNLAPLLSTLPSGKITSLLKLFDDQKTGLLLARLNSLIQSPHKLKDMHKLPDNIGIQLMAKVELEEVPAMIQDKDQLIAALRFTPVDRRIRLLESISIKVLHDILLDKGSVKEGIQAIEKYKNNNGLYDVLLLAVLRARREHFMRYPSETSAISLPFFKTAQETPAAYNLLESAIVKNLGEGHHSGLSFFDTAINGQEQKEMKEAVNAGELGRITQAFRASQS